MDIEQKLKIAKIAKQYLDQAVDALEFGEVEQPCDPDFDLWSALQYLKMVQDVEDTKNEGIEP